MKPLALLLWIIVPIAGFAAYQVYGPPYVIWSYTYVAAGGSHDPFANRRYTSCTYVGWGFETIKTGAPGGRCGWVRFVGPGTG